MKKVVTLSLQETVTQTVQGNCLGDLNYFLIFGAAPVSKKEKGIAEGYQKKFEENFKKGVNTVFLHEINSGKKLMAMSGFSCTESFFKSVCEPVLTDSLKTMDPKKPVVFCLDPKSKDNAGHVFCAMLSSSETDRFTTLYDPRTKEALPETLQDDFVTIVAHRLWDHLKAGDFKDREIRWYQYSYPPRDPFKGGCFSGCEIF